ncbi:MAG TPA: PH domain-containing protein, partial [Acidimicrobiales bacterium]|nr:PH domain-containing protein [Acidimicrobiales bacterium]
MQRDATEPILLDDDLVDSGPLIDDREPERKPFGERFGEWRKHYLPLPDEVVEEYLGLDEYVVHTDHPSFRAFLIQNIVLVLVVTVAGPVFVTLARGGFSWTTLLLFFALDIVLLYMAIQRLRDRYISYVITNLRLIRLQGVFGRRLNSIPWTRMTGLGYFQKPLGRILGYATILIESANEESGLRRFSNINDPATFHQRILDLVSAKTGQSAGGKPPPPTKGVRKSIFQRRKERREMGGPNRAAAPWPTADDPDGEGSGKQSPTDTAGTYEASVPDEDKTPAPGTKQPLRPGSAGRGGPPARRAGQPPPSARRRAPAPPGPTDPFGDPAPPPSRGGGGSPLPGRQRSSAPRPGTPGSAGGPSVAASSPRPPRPQQQRLPRPEARPDVEPERPSPIPDYGRGGRTTPPTSPTPPEASPSGPVTPPRGSARIGGAALPGIPGPPDDPDDPDEPEAGDPAPPRGPGPSTPPR